MSYHTSALVANAAALADFIKTNVDAHPAWVYVETVSGTTVTSRRADVYKCLGSLNSLGVDFYVVFIRSADTSGNCGFSIGEGYDSATKSIIKGAIYNTNVQATLASDGSFGTNLHVANATLGQANGLAVAGSPTSNAGAVVYTSSTAQLSITNDRIICSWQASATIPAAAYAGIFDPVDSTLDPVPLCVVSPQFAQTYTGTPSFAAFAGSNPSGACTREPNSVGQVPLWAMSISADALQFTPPPNPTAAITKDPLLDMWWSSPIRIASGARRGCTRGYLKPDIQGVFINEAVEALGDILYFGAASTNPYACIVKRYVSGSPFSATTTGSVWVDTAA